MLAFATAALSFSALAPQPVSRMGASRVSGLAMSDDPWNDDIKATVTASKAALAYVAAHRTPGTSAARVQVEAFPCAQLQLQEGRF